MHATLHHIEDITPTIKTFWLTPERRLRYSAGQFTEIHLPHEPADERGIRRWFTLSSSPSEDLISITTGFSAERGSSFKRRLLALQPGDTLDLAEPMGDFVLPKDPTIPLVFVAGGLGITPVRSMVKWLNDTGARRNIRLVYVVSQPEELVFTQLFKDYGLQFTPIITSQIGRLDASRLLKMINDTIEPLIYISGPEIMVETLYKDLKAKGVDPGRLVGDYFPGYQQL